MTAQDRESTHIGTKVNGKLKVLCGRKNVRVFMSPELFAEIAREKASPYKGRMCVNCEQTGLRLYAPKPKREPEKAEAPTLFRAAG